MAKTILIGCNLPCGLVVEGLNDKRIHLNGKNTAMIPGAPGLTHVDENEWAYVSAIYADHCAFKANSIFATGSDKVSDIVDLADELKGEKTGFEGLDPDKPEKDLEPYDAKKLAENKVVAAAAGPRKAPVGKGAKAAAIELMAGADS